MILVDVRHEVPTCHLFRFQMQACTKYAPRSPEFPFQIQVLSQSGSCLTAWMKAAHVEVPTPPGKPRLQSTTLLALPGLSSGVKPEQAQVCLFIQLAAFVGIQKAAVDILGCVADVRWK